jgi:type I restriction enzyme S subunit
LPELLPFLCQTDSFFDHAVGTSAGSLSPRTSWKGLAEYALAIPPIEEQRRLSIPLLTANATAISLKVAAARGEEAFHASLHKYMGAEIVNGTIAKQEEITVEGTAELVTLSEISLVERGMFSHRPRNLPEFFGGPYPFVQTGDVAASRGSLGPASQHLSEVGRKYSKSFPAGSILITIAAVIGATAITEQETYCPDSVVGIVPDKDRVDVRFLEYKLRHFRGYLDALEATQTAQKNINLQVLRPLPIVLPQMAEQIKIVGILATLERSLFELASRASRASSLIEKLMAEFSA